MLIGRRDLSLTEGQLVIGTHCLGRHSMLPFTQAQRVQFAEDHMSPSCGHKHRSVCLPVHPSPPASIPPRLTL